VDGLRHQRRLADLLQAAELSRSTFYYHRQVLLAPDSSAGLKDRVGRIFEQHRRRYGYRRITAQLRQEGAHINHKAVQRVMHILGLKSLVRPKKCRSYRGGAHPAAAKLLQRRFAAERPNQAWVADVTEFNVRGEKLYLSPVMDLYNGEIVAFKTASRPTFDLVGGMLRKASTN